MAYVRVTRGSRFRAALLEAVAQRVAVFSYRTELTRREQAAIVGELRAEALRLLVEDSSAATAEVRCA